MTVTLTVFANSPDGGRGLARDMPVRWALEEVGAGYAVKAVAMSDLKTPAHRRLQPFGQIPVYEEDGVALFESGAIVHRIAENHTGLLPTEGNARARAIMWMFAALSTIEPAIVAREFAEHAEAGLAGFDERMKRLGEAVRTRLRDLSARLGAGDWLDGGFSAGDLLMISVLRRLAGDPVLAEFAPLGAYVSSGEARPAFRRAFEAQRRTFEETAGAG